MRNLFLALVLANLLFLGWRLWVAPPDVPPLQLRAAAGETAAASLKPLNEKKNDQADTTQSVLGGTCLRVGPLADGELADTLRARLAAAGFPTSLASEDGQVWVGHWVQLEPVQTREAADQVVARLAAGGLPDAYVLQTSAPFSISLGVFRDRARADAIAAAATRLGFRPQLTDRYRNGVQYWLTVAVPPGRSPSLEQLGRETGQILRAESVACPAPAVGAAPVIP